MRGEGDGTLSCWLMWTRGSRLSAKDKWHIWCSRKLLEEDPAADYDTKPRVYPWGLDTLKRFCAATRVVFSAWLLIRQLAESLPHVPLHFPKSLMTSPTELTMMRSFIVCRLTVSSAAHSSCNYPRGELDIALRLLMHSFTFDFRVSTVSAYPRKPSPIFSSPSLRLLQNMAWRLNLLELNAERGPAYLMSSDREEEVFQCNVWRGWHHFGWKPSTKRRWKVFYQSVLLIKVIPIVTQRIPCPSCRVSFVPALECTSHYSSGDSRWDDLSAGCCP